MVGSVVSPGTDVHSPVITHTIRVAPKMTSTSPGRSAPATICSQKASIDPPANAVLVPFTDPSLCPIPPTTGSWCSVTPNRSSATASQCPPA